MGKLCPWLMWTVKWGIKFEVIIAVLSVHQNNFAATQVVLLIEMIMSNFVNKLFFVAGFAESWAP